MKKLTGTFTAVVTPFREGKIDPSSFEKLLAQQMAGGVTGFVINGTTGESPTLHPREVSELYSLARAACGSKAQIILGTGTNSTEGTIENTRLAESLGADGALVVVPYYNKPPQRGLVAHFKAVAQNTSLPILLYNVPGRTITSLAPESVAELSLVPQIVGIKEASGDINLMKKMKSLSQEDFTFLSGDDGTYVDFLKAGGDGVISVASHLIPQQMVRWLEGAKRGDFAQADAEIQKYLHLINLLFAEANPIPVKMAVHKMGLISSAEVRLPLAVHDPVMTEALVGEMRKQGVLS